MNRRHDLPPRVRFNANALAIPTRMNPLEAKATFGKLVNLSTRMQNLQRQESALWEVIDQSRGSAAATKAEDLVIQICSEWYRLKQEYLELVKMLPVAEASQVVSFQDLSIESF